MVIWGGVAAVVVVFAVILFNTMISRKNAVATAFSSIDVMLKKRYDLIPNLVSVCEQHMGYEQQVLKDLTALRAQVMQAGAEERMQQAGTLAAQLKSVFAVSEAYPELRATESFDHLQRALTDVEAQIAAARRAFNAAAVEYNNACEMVPTNIAARLMGYQLKALFAIDEAEAQPVKVWRQ